MIDKKIKNKLIEFKKIDGRISYLRIKSAIANISLINAYAPTEGAAIEEKEVFYNKLQESCEKIPKHDTLIVLGDYNAKIGREDFIKDVAGKETIHEITTDNGMRLCHLATEMDMYIISTKFKHKKEHKITWNIPGKNKGNQIDHILIKKNRERMIDDVRSYRGTSVETDHNLVISKMKLRMVEEKHRQIKKKWDKEN
ncbi:hypothetical protein RN001_011858 [Aquatica leii]|uniref:Craniofacial development protein 2 n=1 Tax=Aquatica leii TaxID=1421715 RepID=A0AAN7P6G0_9COLE|nr:hypothetical protein RN001_011858 [Aquatica leii]